MRQGIRQRRKAGSQGQEPLDALGTVAIVDPGTVHLRVLVAELDNRQATIWGWAQGSSWRDTSAEQRLALVEETLARAEDMARDRARRPMAAQQMIVGLSPSELYARAWSVVQSRPRPERPVDDRELEALLSRTLRLARSGLLTQAAESERRQGRELGAAPGGEDRWPLVEALPVALTVDGRRVTDPVGFSGEKLGATVFAAVAQADLLDTWRQIAQALDFLALTVAVVPVALTSSLPVSEGILLDVGGVTTDLVIWRGGRPVALESILIGGTALTRALVDAWRLPVEQVEAAIQLYAGGRLDVAGRAQVRDVLFPAVRSWLEQVESALARFSLEEPLPQRLYLTGGGSTLPDVAEAVRSLSWSEKLCFSRYPQVTCLMPTDISGIVNRTDRGHEAGDVTVLTLAAWAAHQTAPQGRPDRILGELAQSYQPSG